MGVKGLRISYGLFWVSLLLLLAGAVLLGAAWWVRPIQEAEQAMQDHDIDRALGLYAIAEGRFDRISVTKRLLPRMYSLAVINQLSSLYELQRYDAVIDKANQEGSSQEAPFWAGCALFAKGAMEEKPEARLSWLSQSQEEFRRVLDALPNDWDAKFNFELTGRLIAALRKEPKTTKQEMMQLLRPPPKSQREPTRKIG